MEQNDRNHLQIAVDQAGRRGDVLAVASGKGGVGKTNIAVNLSICMAMAGKKVLLMDADLGLGNLDVVMDINSRYNISHVISGKKNLREITHIGPEGIEVICGGSGLEDLANLNHFQQERLIRELQQLQDQADVIIIDTGAGINNSVVRFCQSSDQTLIVTTPEPTAMTDAYAMIKVLSSRDYAGRITLIVNMADSAAEGKKVYRQISEVASRFLGRAIYEGGVICRDDKVYAAVKKRRPVVLSYPRSNVTASMVTIAARLTRAYEAKTSEEGFFRKVANWFF